MFAKGAASPGAKANDDDDDMTIIDGKPVKRKEKLSRAQRKAQRDPNEPKRPVTAYFLFLQHARPQLAKDMPNAKGNELQQEATERWNGMSEEDKRVCSNTIPPLPKIISIFYSSNIFSLFVSAL